MKRKFLLYDIAWDTDEEDVDLPKREIIDSASSLEQLQEGEAADFLSDEYGYLVASLKVEELDHAN